MVARVCGEGLALASDDFGGAEVDVFYDAVVVEEDVWKGQLRLSKRGKGGCTLGLDVPVDDVA